MLRARIPILTILILLGASAVGCAKAEIPPRYFVMTADLRAEETPTKKDESRKAAPGAGNLLRNGRAVAAFVAPPWCDAPSSPELAARQRACLALLGELERKAAAEGYRVIDRGRLKPDLYTGAAREGVEVLFIIDALSVRTAAMETLEVSRFDFSEQQSAETRAPIRLKNSGIVTARCEAALKARKRRTAVQDRVTGIDMSVKMVSAVDGSAQWFYQGDLQNETDEDLKSNAFYYLSEGTKKTKGKKLAGGIVSLTVGAAALGSGVYMNQNGDSFVSRNLGAGLAWVSILPLTIGAVLTTVGIVAQAKPPVYESPDTVLCAKPPFVENPFSQRPQSPAEDAMPGPPPPSSRSTDSAAEVTERLVDRFFAALDTLSSDRVPRTSEGPATRQVPAVATPPQSTTAPPEDPPKARIAPRPTPDELSPEPPPQPSRTPPPSRTASPAQESPPVLILRKPSSSGESNSRNGGRND